MKCILPCAGFGTRMGMSKTDAKEMLPDNIYDYKHIIDYSLKLCKRFNMEPLVITRKEKESFREYLKENSINFIDIEVGPKDEWPQTVLKSKEYWDDNNLLLLPDTRFNGEFVIEDIEESLKMGNNAVLALHKVPDPEKWGIVHNYRIYEKPICFDEAKYAWGLIGFKKEYGEELFTRMGKEMKNVGFVYLDSFQDITRK